MARASTTTDVFNAIAEPRRRELIGLLSDGQEWAVNDLVAKVDIEQPTVSKHLSILLQVGVVNVAKKGQQRMYRLDPMQLKPIHDWVKAYECYWNHQISRIKQIAERREFDKMVQAQAPHPAK